MFGFQNPHGISQQYEASIRLSHAALLIDNDAHMHTYIAPLGLFKWLTSENLFLYINLKYIYCSFLKNYIWQNEEKEYYLVLFLYFTFFQSRVIRIKVFCFNLMNLEYISVLKHS